EALEKYRESMETGKKYNIVLLDLTVPGGMGGKETAAKILGIDHDACIIATSGYSNDPIMANYEDYGFKTVLKKPYDFEEIKSTIAGLLK
ncbi:MAG: response regulator, partial [Spirochaetales bacterium]|nr:response regulator [Spirochaetales bacterium]